MASVDAQVVGHYHAATDDPTIGARGHLDLHADHRFELAFALDLATGVALPQLDADAPEGQFVTLGTWRVDAQGVVLDQGHEGEPATADFVLSRRRDGDLELVGPCLTLRFAWWSARPPTSPFIGNFRCVSVNESLITTAGCLRLLADGTFEAAYDLVEAPIPGLLPSPPDPRLSAHGNGLWRPRDPATIELRMREEPGANWDTAWFLTVLRAVDVDTLVNPHPCGALRFERARDAR